MDTDYRDKFNDYHIVVESATEPNLGMKILKEERDATGQLRYLKFRATLQTFGKRNRNKRLWLSKWMKIMLMGVETQEMLQRGGVPGEAGHPVPPTGEVTIARIVTIDPNNISHVVKEYIWKTDDILDGIIETIDDGNGPGDRFKRNIMQGLPTSFSTRSIIPQRKNPDGTIDQTGPGRYVCSDRVFVPAHAEAYLDTSIPIKNICKQSEFESVMESYTNFVVEHSNKFNTIVHDMDPAVESARFDKNGILSVPTREGHVFVRPELKYRREFADIMRMF